MGSLPRALLVLLALALIGPALSQEVSLNGELGLDTGVTYTRVAGRDSLAVPVIVRGRLELGVTMAPGLNGRATLVPAFGVGPADEELLFSPGLQEAFLQFESGEWQLSAGLERLQPAEMRLLPPLSPEPLLETGEPRGLPGVTITRYAGAWRVQGKALALFLDDWFESSAGGSVSLRYDSLDYTVEGHLLWAERLATGSTFSASLDPLVVFGELWLLSDPWEVAAWAPTAGTLLAEPHPAVAISASRPLGFDASFDAVVTGRWVPDEDGIRLAEPAIDGVVNLSFTQGDDMLTFSPAVSWRDGLLAVDLGLSWRSFF